MNMKPMKNAKKQTQPASFLISLVRSSKLGFTNFWRNKFLSIATIAVIAVIIFIFNVILAVHFITNEGLRDISSHVDFSIDLKNDLGLYDVQNLIKEIKTLDGIKDVQFRSKEEALQIVAKTHPETVEFYKKFNLKNPLPPSLIIKPEKPDTYQKVEELLQKSIYKNLLQNNEISISGSENNILSNASENLNNIQIFIRQIIFWVILAFVSGGTLVIVNAIQLTIYTRRQEISIMRLVGATPNFIRLPFIVEGILYSFFAVMLSFIFLIMLGKTIQIQNGILWNYYNNFQLQTLFSIELLVTLTLGIISSFSAAEQYIKGKLTIH